MVRAPAALFAVLVLAACSEVSSPEPDRPRPAAAVTQDVQRIPIEEVSTFPVPRGCTGEPVEWHLRQEILFRQLWDAQGQFHGTFVFQDRGSYGVGLATGTMYRLAQVQAEHYEITGGQGENDSAVFLRRFISQGDMPNFRVTNTFHYTLDANGNLTSWRNDFSRICD